MSTGIRSEKRLAARLGKRVPGSGCGYSGRKGDIDAGDVLVEAKSTENRSISLKHAWLAKIAREALNAGKRPALTLSFVTGDGRSVPLGDWVCIPLIDWEELRELDNDG
jgi:hypothetical protein